MPELPEVEFCARRLRAWTAGRVVVAIEASPGPPLAVEPAALASALVGARLLAVERHGKQLFVRLPAATLALHLGMTGKIIRVAAGTVPRRGTRAQLGLDDATRLDFVDPRRFGQVDLLDAEREGRPRGSARTPWRWPADLAALAARFVGARSAIKVALLDQPGWRGWATSTRPRRSSWPGWIRGDRRAR
ncbi:MAG: DNA-formamidopyrimidine glycosylase family protein [bacterium]